MSARISEERPLPLDALPRLFVLSKRLFQHVVKSRGRFIGHVSPFLDANHLPMLDLGCYYFVSSELS